MSKFFLIPQNHDMKDFAIFALLKVYNFFLQCWNDLEELILNCKPNEWKLRKNGVISLQSYKPWNYSAFVSNFYELGNLFQYTQLNVKLSGFKWFHFCITLDYVRIIWVSPLN